MADSMFRNILVNSSMTLFSLAFCALLGEVVLRVIPPPSKAQWQDRPNFYYLPEDAENLQGNIHSKQKDPGAFRIAVIGDSFTFAPFMQFDDGFPARLERMLNLRRPGDGGQGKRVEVMNYGVPGFSTSHEVPLAKRALDEGADLILLQITLNDPELKPYQPHGITIRKNDQGAIVVDTSGGSASWLRNHSRLYAFLFGRVNVYKQGKSYEEYFRDLFSDKSAMTKFDGALQEIKKSADEKNVPMLAVVFPLFGSKLDDAYPFKVIHKSIAETLDKLAVKHLDLEAFYQGIPADRLQVMPGEDYHPNEIGHRIAAEAIYCWMKKEKLIPPEFASSPLLKTRAQLLLPKADGTAKTSAKAPDGSFFAGCSR